MKKTVRSRQMTSNLKSLRDPMVAFGMCDLDHKNSDSLNNCNGHSD